MSDAPNRLWIAAHVLAACRGRGSDLEPSVLARRALEDADALLEAHQADNGRELYVASVRAARRLERAAQASVGAARKVFIARQDRGAEP